MFGFINVMRKKNREMAQQHAMMDGYTDAELMESDSDTDDEHEAVARKKRQENEMFYSNLKRGIFTSLGMSRKDGEGNSETDTKPIDYYYNSQHHPSIWPINYYLDHLSAPSVKILEQDRFNNFIIGVIIVAGINVGVQTYPETENMLFFVILDFLILAVFVIECLLKIFAEGLRPHRYFVGPEWAWNTFDFIVVVFSMPVWDQLFSGGSSVALLRLVRLARLGKLIKKIPPLQMIMSGLLGGLSSITYILLLLFLVFYLYGIVGMMLYKKGDPFHFGSLPIALLNLFRISLLENWSDIMYVNIFGCDYYADVYVDPSDKTPFNAVFWCDNPATDYYIAPFYFISFVIISAFVMLSLFIGAITMSMNESMEEVKQNTIENQRQLAMERNSLKMQAIAEKVKMKATQDRATKSQSNSQVDEDMLEEDFNENAKKLVEGHRSTRRGSILDILLSPMERMRASEETLWVRIKSYFTRSDEDHGELSNRIQNTLKLALGDIKSKEELEMDEDDSIITVETTTHWFWEVYGKLADVCKKIVDHWLFGHFMTFIIILAGLNVGLDTDKRLAKYEWLWLLLDEIILYIFTIEVALKMIGEKWYPSHYFASSWNRFDFLIVVGSYINAVGSAVTILRLLRLLRVLKLVKRLPQLAVIINALINGLVSIGYIGVILFLVFYIFAILGIIIFKDNDPWHFSHLHLALISLFRTATLDNVSSVWTVSMYGCAIGGDVYEDFPDQCREPQELMVLTVIYYIIFVVLAAQVLLTLFIGVISASMEEARAAKALEMATEEEVF